MSIYITCTEKLKITRGTPKIEQNSHNGTKNVTSD